MNQPLHYLDIASLAKMIQAREISPIEVTQYMLDRIEQVDAKLNSYLYVSHELALQQAKQAESEISRGEYRGLLHGIPLGIKDLFWVKDLPCTGGMGIHQDFIPTENATVVDRLIKAGAVILGKLHMTEGAYASHHPAFNMPFNPWSEKIWTGASSSGSGIAVAAGLCFAALGSDTGGSIRFPAAANGITGLKPTWGAVSRFGCYELSGSLDHIGPMARTTEDVALLYSTIAGYDPKDVTSLDSDVRILDGSIPSLAGLKIGVDEAWMYKGVDIEVQQSLQNMIKILQKQGAIICPIHMPNTKFLNEHWEVHCGVQTAIAHEATYPLMKAGYGEALSRLIETGHQTPATLYQQLLTGGVLFTGKLNQIFMQVDTILAPVQPYAAPSLERLSRLVNDSEENSKMVKFTSPFNISSHPCLSLPAGFTHENFPLGCQFIAQKGQEKLLCNLGIALQKITDWHLQHPVA